MKVRLHRNAQIKIWESNGNEPEHEFHFQRQRVAIIEKLYEICDRFSLDFRDFKGAMDHTGFFKDIKSFERILHEGLPDRYIKDLDNFDKLSKAIDCAFRHCIDGTYKLKYSDIKTVKAYYEKFKDQEMGELWQSAMSARRANPEWNREEEEAYKVFINEKIAKYFFDAIECKLLEEIKDENGLYYKVPQSVCLALYEMLKSDPQIMKRLEKRFNRKDYPPFE